MSSECLDVRNVNAESAKFYTTARIKLKFDVDPPFAPFPPQVCNRKPFVEIVYRFSLIKFHSSLRRIEIPYKQQQNVDEISRLRSLAI
jgi:hypothetical protein